MSIPDRLDDFCSLLESEIESYNFSAGTGQEAYGVLALARCVDLARSLVTLMRDGRVGSQPMIVRSMLEQFIDAECVLREPTVIDQLHANLLDQRRRFADHVLASETETDLDLAQLEEDSRENDEKLAALKAAGNGPVTIFRRFELVGRVDWYRLFYALLSAESHNSLEVLESRHLRELEGEFAICVQPNEDPVVVSACAEISGSVLGKLYEILPFSASGKADARKEELLRALHEAQPNNKLQQTGGKPRAAE